MSWTRMSWLEEEDGVVASAASPAPGPVWVELPADSVFNPKTSSHGFPSRVNRFNLICSNKTRAARKPTTHTPEDNLVKPLT